MFMSKGAWVLGLPGASRQLLPPAHSGEPGKPASMLATGLPEGGAAVSSPWSEPESRLGQKPRLGGRKGLAGCEPPLPPGTGFGLQERWWEAEEGGAGEGGAGASGTWWAGTGPSLLQVCVLQATGLSLWYPLPKFVTPADSGNMNGKRD